MLSRAWLMDAPFWLLITANAFWALFLHVLLKHPKHRFSETGLVLLSIPRSDCLRQVLAFCFQKVYETRGSSRLPKSQVCTSTGVEFSGIQTHVIHFLFAHWSKIKPFYLSRVDTSQKYTDDRKYSLFVSL